VVTANKKMLAHHLDELLALKQQHHVSLLYEASVCGSIPIIRNLEEYYNHDSLRAISAITNGTSNYILTKMDKERKSFQEVLSEAQKLGFAESDPTLDIDGFDSKYKLTILVRHAFGVSVNQRNIINFGIRHIQPFVFQFAEKNGLKIRLISFAEKIENSIRAYVVPKFVKPTDFEYNVDFEFNSVSLEAAFSDRQYFKGKGAGSFPTASAVLSDLAALQYHYNYNYKVNAKAETVFTNAFEKRFFAASSSIEYLSAINFSSIEEKHSTNEYSYIIGRLNFSELNHDFYYRNANVFLAELE
jgi:homoserine dehydrogenase